MNRKCSFSQGCTAALRCYNNPILSDYGDFKRDQWEWNTPFYMQDLSHFDTGEWLLFTAWEQSFRWGVSAPNIPQLSQLCGAKGNRTLGPLCSPDPWHSPTFLQAYRSGIVLQFHLDFTLPQNSVTKTLCFPMFGEMIHISSSVWPHSSDAQYTWFHQTTVVTGVFRSTTFGKQKCLHYYSLLSYNNPTTQIGFIVKDLLIYSSPQNISWKSQYVEAVALRLGCMAWLLGVGACLEGRIRGPTPDLLSQNLHFVKILGIVCTMSLKSAAPGSPRHFHRAPQEKCEGREGRHKDPSLSLMKVVL